jgi:hypothetical protein
MGSLTKDAKAALLLNLPSTESSDNICRGGIKASPPKILSVFISSPQSHSHRYAPSAQV